VINHLARITQDFLGHGNVKSAVICVPAKFNQLQRQETVTAFRNAGITVARIVEEPTAAALAYGLHRKQGVDHILVYDFGGGTLDISLLHVSEGFVDVMGSDGDDRLGGTDFDVAIAHYLLLQRGGNEIVHTVAIVLHQLEQAVQAADLEDVLSAQCPALHETPLCTMSSFHTIGEQLKIRLSEAYSPDQEATVSAECLGLPDDDANSGSAEWTVETFCASLQPVTLTLNSSEFSQIAQPLLDRSIVPVTRLLTDLDLSAADIDEIVMVGGTTRMPQIRQLVQDVFSVSQLNIHIDPDITVAYGAASVID
jgi:molecular chaperone DnaK (HSP70)